MSEHIEGELHSLPAEPEASKPLNADSGSETDPVVYKEFQQLRTIWSGIVIVLDILLCILSAALLYLCQYLIRALENTDEPSRREGEGSPAQNCGTKDECTDPIDSLLEADGGSSNAPTYKALYENEVEINHRVFHEMIALQHKLESNRPQELDKPAAPSEPEEISPSTQIIKALNVSSATEAYINESFEEPGLQASSTFATDAEESCTQEFSFDGSSSNQSWQSRRTSQSSPCTPPGSPEPRKPSDQIYKVTDTSFQNPALRNADATQSSSGSGVFPPPAVLPLFGIPNRRAHTRLLQAPPSPTAMKQQPQPQPQPQPQQTGGFDASHFNEIARGAVRQATPPRGPALRDAPRRPSHSADKLLEEIVVGRARLRPRTQGC